MRLLEVVSSADKSSNSNHTTTFTPHNFSKKGIDNKNQTKRGNAYGGEENERDLSALRTCCVVSNIPNQATTVSILECHIPTKALE